MRAKVIKRLRKLARDYVTLGSDSKTPQELLDKEIKKLTKDSKKKYTRDKRK